MRGVLWLMIVLNALAVMGIPLFLRVGEIWTKHTVIDTYGELRRADAINRERLPAVKEFNGGYAVEPHPERFFLRGSFWLVRDVGYLASGLCALNVLIGLWCLFQMRVTGSSVGSGASATVPANTEKPGGGGL